MTPLISICVLTYNHENFIEKSLKRIFSQSIIIIWNNYEEIKSTLIIRSNDFTEGQLKKELVFKK